MIGLEVGIDNRENPIVAALIGLEQQLPFAISRGLNATVNDAQKAIQNSLAQNFTLRRPDFDRKTIYRMPGVDFATKTNLAATVRVNPARDILAKFEDETTKRSVSGRSLAVPILRQDAPGLIIGRGSPLAVKTIIALIESQGGKQVGPFKRRGAKKAAQQAFFFAKGRSGKTLIIQRTGPSQTRVVWEMTREVPIEKHRLHFGEIALVAALASYDRRLSEAIEYAIATAR